MRQGLRSRRVQRVLTTVTAAGALSVLSAGVVLAAADFSDVDDDHQFSDEIQWMSDTGISEGYSDGTYRPGNPVTRQAMAAFMMRAAGQDPDVDPMVDAATLNGATREQLTTQIFTSEFDPASDVTSAQTAGSLTVDTGDLCGTVSLRATAPAVTFGAHTVVQAQLSTETDTVDEPSVQFGVLDGSDTDRRRYTLQPQTTFPILSAGEHEFHFNVARSSTFDSETVNVGGGLMIAEYHPASCFTFNPPQIPTFPSSQ